MLVPKRSYLSNLICDYYQLHTLHDLTWPSLILNTRDPSFSGHWLTFRTCLRFINQTLFVIFGFSSWPTPRFWFWLSQQFQFIKIRGNTTRMSSMLQIVVNCGGISILHRHLASEEYGKLPWSLPRISNAKPFLILHERLRRGCFCRNLYFWQFSGY